MMNFCFRPFARCSIVLLSCIVASPAQGQGAKQSASAPRVAGADFDHEKERGTWFYRGRIVSGKNSAELRRRAARAKMEMRMHRAEGTAKPAAAGAPASLSGSWIPLGPVPLASDASGIGVQDYHQVSG